MICETVRKIYSRTGPQETANGSSTGAHDVGDPPLRGHEAEYAIGCRDQLPGEADPFGFIAVKQIVAGTAGENCCKVPGEIEGVANPGIHALSAGRAVDVRCVGGQEGSSFAEMLGHPMMHMIGRKPIDLLDLAFEVVDLPVADVFKRQRIGAVGSLVAYRSDQARSSSSGPREDPP